LCSRNHRVRAIETKKTQIFYPIAQEQYQLHLHYSSQIGNHNQQSVAVETKERVLNTQNRNQSRTKNKDLFISRTLWRNQSLSGQQRQIEWDQNWGDWSRHERNMSRTKTLLQKQWAPIGSGTLLATWMKNQCGSNGGKLRAGQRTAMGTKMSGGHTHLSRRKIEQLERTGDTKNRILVHGRWAGTEKRTLQRPLQRTDVKWNQNTSGDRHDNSNQS
jgi:hypothetical protein